MLQLSGMALLARFACGCTQRVEIPAPPEVRCPRHACVARLITTPKGQVRYVAERSAEDLNREGTLAGPVELAQVDGLPAAEGEGAAADGDQD